MKRPVVPTTKLLIQPGAGIEDLLQGIEQARESIHIVIFRFDRSEIEMALKRAARRGVFVHALVAFTSSGQGGEATLRKLEMRLLADGVSVARTATDLARYHDKLMIIDGKTLYMLGFNYTYLDIERSRSFGIITTEPAWVAEAEKLFLADTMRQQYTPECDTFLVSPGNSRKELMKMLAATRRQLLIYDGKLSDPDVMRLLASHVRQGIDVRVIGAVGKRAVGVKVAPSHIRLHAQVVIRDGEQFFLGSQSLRTLELDARREVGLVINDPQMVSQMVQTFESDWEIIQSKQPPLQVPLHIEEHAEKIPYILPDEEPVNPLSIIEVKEAIKEAIIDTLLEKLEPELDVEPLKQLVKDAAKEALHDLAI